MPFFASTDGICSHRFFYIRSFGTSIASVFLALNCFVFFFSLFKKIFFFIDSPIIQCGHVWIPVRCAPKQSFANFFARLRLFSFGSASFTIFISRFQDYVSIYLWLASSSNSPLARLCRFNELIVLASWFELAVSYKLDRSCWFSPFLYVSWS